MIVNDAIIAWSITYIESATQHLTATGTHIPTQHLHPPLTEPDRVQFPTRARSNALLQSLPIPPCAQPGGLSVGSQASTLRDNLPEEFDRLPPSGAGATSDRPQQATVPSVCSPHEWYQPAAKAVNGPSGACDCP